MAKYDDLKVGFIGGGAMGGAIVAGITAAGIVAPEHVYVSDHKQARCDELHEKYGVVATVGAEGFAGSVDVLFIAVKPQVADDAIDEIKKLVRKETLIISIVAGLKLNALREAFDYQNNPYVRVMPNTPLAVGEGMSAFACGEHVKEKERAIVSSLLSSAGRAVEVKESLLDAVTGLSGSGPAYVFLMIDALADGGVAAGLKRADAIELAAQTVLGSARMVLESGQHPDVLRDQVTSPAGTTIAGVRVLEQHGFRGALIDAVLAATEKSRELGKK